MSCSASDRALSQLKLAANASAGVSQMIKTAARLRMQLPPVYRRRFLPLKMTTPLKKAFSLISMICSGQAGLSGFR